MATRRCLRILTRHYSSFLLSPNPSLKTLKALNPALFDSLRNLTFSQDCLHISTKSHTQYPFISRNFCSKHNDGSEDESGDEGEEEFDDFSDDDGDAELREANSGPKSPEDKIKEAAEIGYKVIGPLEKSDRAFKPYEPVFAVVQIGSHQFKVSNGDSIFVERLKYCDVNDKLILNKVLMLGSQTQTIIGRPILPDVAVHAVVEEHALDAKVLIFKKKRRKNYRRTRGHRQELTKLRITDIQGIEKPEVMPSLKTGKSGAKPADKVAVAA
nr:50S ribosomal protein L21, mitochondrial [Ipomoea trifida]